MPVLDACPTLYGRETQRWNGDHGTVSSSVTLRIKSSMLRRKPLMLINPPAAK